MAHGRRWGLGVGAGLLVVGVLAVGVVKRETLSARYAAYSLARAGTPEERVRRAGELLDLGPQGRAHFLAIFRDADGEMCQAAALAFRERYGTIDPGDAEAIACSRGLLDGFAAASEAGKAATLDLLPVLVKSPGPETVPACLEVVRHGLTGAKESKLVATRFALHPAFQARELLVPLLDDAEAEVRRAALLALGPVPDEEPAVLGEEELFRHLHDADAEVRELCGSALRSRGLELGQISLARQLTHPDPAERMRLLTDLGTEALVKDPGPWLERLSRDADPAIRLGSARVAYEMGLQFKGWLTRLGAQDPDPTVRQWVAYYGRQAEIVRQAGYDR